MTPKLIAVSGILFLMLLTAMAVGQDGVSTEGSARARYLGEMGAIPSPHEVIVEDFINYHRHEIPRPNAGESVAMDLRWERESVSNGGDAVLQVGLSTSLVHDRQELRPLNLSIVIDKSGSMAAENKMTRVKEALQTLVSQLRPKDVLGIVVFDEKAQVLVPAEHVTTPERIKEAIRGIETGSSTNLNAGLMLGYKEAEKHFRKDATNRVILLTDGIANRGVIDPEKIAEASASYNDQGIDLSTIGVGLDLNRDLLSELAQSGRGLFHFLANSDDIKKVFVTELQSLISPVATEPSLHLDYDTGLEMEKVYGYDPKLGQNAVDVKLDNMNSGMTEIVLIRFKAKNRNTDNSPLTVRATLGYYDLGKNQPVTANKGAMIAMSDVEKRASVDDSVAKNYAIAELAQSIREMSADCQNHQYSKARSEIQASILKTRERYPSMDDEDIKRTISIAEKYREILDRQAGEPSEVDVQGEATNVGNIIVNGDFSQGNSGFSSELGCVFPTYNCLWSGPYTISPSFNNPVLHSLITPDSFPAPKQLNGNSQVMYANAGQHDSLVLWSELVKCRPYTKYRISFYAISLSGSVPDGQSHQVATSEWVPEFSIKVDSDESVPQSAGCGTYSKVSFLWNSKGQKTATVNIVRMPIKNRGGIIGISNIEMTPNR